MAIQILKQPDDISWSRNPILYEFHTDKVVQDPGRPVIFSLDFSNVENESFNPPPPDLREWLIYTDWGFHLTVGQETIYFTCVYDTESDGFIIPHRVAEPEEPKPDWLIRVRDAIISAYDIVSQFNIEIGADKLIFTGKQDNEALVISINNDDTFHAVALTVSQSATNTQYTPNLKIFCELLTVDDHGHDKVVISAALSPDLNGNAIWDFSKPLTSECLSAGADLPSLYDVVFSKGKVVREYFVQLTELYGEPQTAKMSIRGTRKRVVYGGLPKHLQHWTFLNSLSSTDDRIRFMNSYGWSLKVTTDQPNYLSWFNFRNDLESVKVQVELTYKDGTIYNFTAHTFETVQQYEKLVIPIGLKQLGANDFYPELSIDSYIVSLKSAGRMVSDYHLCTIDDRVHIYKRFFLYQNSLGAFETFFTVGRKSNSYEIEKSNARIIQVNDFVLEKGEDIDFDIQLQEKEKINTGWKSKHEIKRLRDFFMSSEKLTLIDGKWWPISVSSNSIEEFQDGNGMYALAFEITLQHTQEMFFDN